MFVPFISTRSTSAKDSKRLYRRKGGGGGGRGGGGGGVGGGGGGGEFFDTQCTRANVGIVVKTLCLPGGRSGSVSTGGSSRSASTYNRGGGSASTIPQGQLFAGRQQGGGTRDQVVGTRTYGSGYPGVAGRGTAGLGFPFYFWPLAWGGVAGGGGAAYLHNREYGRSDNSSRPGGPMVSAVFVSNSTNQSAFRILADNQTVVDLIQDIRSNCSSNLGPSSSTSPSSYNDTSDAPPQPEQAVQYFRASSVALTLDGYNNSATFASEGTPDTPLPTNIDNTLLDCLNQTIALAVPLIDGADPRWAVSNMGFLGLAWVLWSLSSYF
ncbi:hypothetical protein HGRIS_011880 [Hohenbuehelia grisea]|uniref:Uncharacterized protein n=1 Tax=Hohenbuehelia grisea TaxID=104357 RepID=A0ABR3JY69_9AGAR